MSSANSRTNDGCRLGADDIDALRSDRKIAVLATLDRDELPHLTLITTLEAKTDRRLMFGQFCEGMSKSNLRRDARAGFAVVDSQRRLWRGTARWTGQAQHGEDYEAFNRKPMFRYNAYAGIHTVHYLDVVSCHGAERLALPSAALGSLAVSGLRRLLAKGTAAAALKPWAVGHVNRMRTLKFAAVVGADGYPHVAAALPCAAVGPSRLLLAAIGNASELRGLRRGTVVAVLALNLELESVLIRGRMTRIALSGMERIATIDVDWVYNSMPFKQGPIFPSNSLRAA